MTWAVLKGISELTILDSTKPDSLQSPHTLDIFDRPAFESYTESFETSSSVAFRAFKRALESDKTGWNWAFARHRFKLDQRVLVMGILNYTPDSFYDGGRYNGLDAALERAERMVSEGADIIDIGGESTRPSAHPVSLDDELGRVIPVIETLARRDYLISLDTRHALVAEEGLNAGASIINNVAGFRDQEMVDLMARTDAGGIIMHMQGEPRTMQTSPSYTWATGEIALFLAQMLDRLNDAGVDEQRLVIDPGIGFGKTLDHNIELFRNLSLLKGLGRPILIGASRKSFIGGILDLPVENRLEGSIAAAVIAVMNGARIVRVHDIKETVRAIRVAEKML